ncbi:MAG: AarF/ABC1/UbiB kinase family protein [Desulfobulbaceae bacterium]|uniref:AarF/ABC1/UbiB kinase family protein n=1 Tax=Candidatus Desulfobia pelagia TaxID=2841692 RepID=A0A8J6TFR3_9BACT|nr:AarF/ABC1/UbiB kinase family protein [Candidatus Desulfobia pelagia]
MLNIRKISATSRTYRNLGRYREILTILFKYGFGELIDTLKIEQYLEISLQMLFKKQPKNIEKLSRPERIRLVFEELGPTFIKFGQILSTRPDLIPYEYAKELEKLQDDVPPFEYNEIRRIIWEDFGQSLDAVFQSFEEKPMAAASIGQVHRATLGNGEEVVVKVQRPDIRKIIEVDLEIMLHLGYLMERHLEEFEIQNPTRLVSIFARIIEKEINYKIEASNIERFGRQFLDNPTIYIPKVYHDLTTTHVITMEYVKGVKASEIVTLRNEGYDLVEIADRGAALLMDQFFVQGFFHADPHPGNILILPDNVICYVDFGMMGRISRRERHDFADLIMYIVRRNEKKVVDVILKLVEVRGNVARSELESDVAELIDSYLDLPLKHLEVGPIMQQLLEMVSRHKLCLKPNLYLVVKSAATVEGLGRVLNPDFEIVAHAEPFIKKLQIQRYHPQNIAGDLLESGAEMFELMKEIPGEMREILRLTRQGRIKIEFEHRGLEALLTHLDRTSNRIAFAIVLAAQVIGSALIVLADVPPKWNGIPVIGLLGFLVAVLMGFWLLISMLRHGRL